MTGFAARAQATQTVLVIYGDSRTLAAVAEFDERFRAALRAGTKADLDVISEFLELGRYPDDRYPQLAAHFLREKYKDTKILAVVAGGPMALRFLLQHGAAIFPDTTIVHAYVDSLWLAGRALPSNVIGVPARFDVAKTVEVALHLHPNARRMVVVTGGSAMDQHLLSFFQRDAPSFAGRVAFEYWDALPMSDLLIRLAALPPDSIVLTSSVLRDAAGKWFTGRESIRLMSKASTAPIYGIISPQVGAGLVGGYMPTLQSTGEETAKIVLRLASGEKVTPDSLPPHLPNHHIFDWRELQRWQIADDRLPQGSVVLFREPSLYEKYGWRIVVGRILVGLVLLLCIAEAVLIARLVAERRRRKRFEAELIESEKRMSLAANAVGLALWMWDLDTSTIWVSQRGRSLLGLKSEGDIDFERFMRAVHPADRSSARATIERSIASRGEFAHELRIVRSDGAARWIESRGRPEFAENGRPLRVRGVAIDVTARKEAEAEAQQHRNQAAHLSRVTILGQLSGALAHELNQPLSAILSNAEAAQRFLQQDSVNLDELREILADIIADDQRASAVIERLRSLLKRGESERRILDVNEIVREVQRLCHSDLVTRNIQLVTQLTPGLPAIDGDVVQLQQVFLNLIVNACDAMADNAQGRRTITVRTSFTDREGLRVSVSDLGPGLRQEQIERIFEPFVTSKSNGMGLGLSISRSIARAHGGQLKATNNSSGGATFSLTLPVRIAAEVA